MRLSETRGLQRAGGRRGRAVVRLRVAAVAGVTGADVRVHGLVAGGAGHLRVLGVHLLLVAEHARVLAVAGGALLRRRTSRPRGRSGTRPAPARASCRRGRRCRPCRRATAWPRRSCRRDRSRTW